MVISLVTIDNFIALKRNLKEMNTKKKLVIKLINFCNNSIIINAI